MVDAGRGRRPLFATLLALSLLAVFEGGALLVHRLVEGRWFSYREAAAARSAIREAGGSLPLADPERVDVPRGLSEQTLHPYLGYVFDLDLGTRPERGADRLAVTPYGFLRPPGPERVPPDAYRVGIVGGSAAFLFSFKARATLLAGLGRLPAAAGRPVVVESLAIGGYKQPQQLLTVAYLLSLGEHFDLIVNLDGFNELVLGWANAEQGVHPSYPGRWAERVGDVDDPAALLLIGRLASLRDRRARAAAVADRRPLRHSVGATVVWRLWDRRLAHRTEELELALAGRAAAGDRPAVTGPPYAASGERRLRDLADLWRRGSLQLHRLCAAAGTRYLHLLQPNQYLPDSKPMGAEERARAFRADHPYRETVEKGYPYLIAAGRELRAAGVDFHDLTLLFRDLPEPIYVDDCCHFGQRGNELVAEYLLSALRDGGPR